MNRLPEYFFISESDGCLYDTRKEKWHRRAPLRHNYRTHHRRITSAADLKATLRAGEWAFPGGYTLYFITNDGHAVSFKGVKADFRTQLDQVKKRTLNRIVWCEINYEDTELVCDITGEYIPSSYGND